MRASRTFRTLAVLTAALSLLLMALPGVAAAAEPGHGDNGNGGNNNGGPPTQAVPNTPVPPATPVPPPPTSTPLPPPPTSTPVPQPTDTPVPQPTSTPVPPAAPPTEQPTSVPATEVPTPVPPPVNTPVPVPTSTPQPASSGQPTSVPPTAQPTSSTPAPTSTPVPPTSAPTPTSAPSSGGGGGGLGGGGGGSSRASAPTVAPAVETPAVQTVDVAGARAVAPAPEATKPPFVPVIPTALPTPVATPVTQPGDEAPTFVLGFAFLKQQLGASMGVPLDNEHGDTATCDTQQRTTTGLAYWRCSTNTMTFAALPDGLVHWAWLGQLVTWTGPSPDAPADATVVINPTALGDDLNAEACRPAADGSLTCRIRDGSTSTGYIKASGQTDAYLFNVASPKMHITADLTDLPADYDLYLADGSGAVLSASAREGLSPEQVDLDVGPGTYYLFVHSDPGREFDPTTPYHLHLAMAAPLPPNAASAPVEAP